MGVTQRGRNKALRDRKQKARIWSWRPKTFDVMLLGPSTEDNGSWSLPSLTEESVGYSLGEDRNVGERGQKDAEQFK